MKCRPETDSGLSCANKLPAHCIPVHLNMWCRAQSSSTDCNGLARHTMAMLGHDYIGLKTVRTQYPFYAAICSSLCMEAMLYSQLDRMS